MAELHTRRSVLKKGGAASAFAVFGGLGVAGLTGCEPDVERPRRERLEVVPDRLHPRHRDG